MFNWFKKPKVETRSTTQTTYIDSAALGLSFLKNNLGKDMMSLSAVFCAIELISSSIAQLAVHVKYREDGKIIPNHLTNTLLENAPITKFMMFKMMISDALMYGDGLSYISRAADGTPIEITYCEKGTYSINYNPLTKRVLYNIDGIGKTVEDCDVIHIYKNSKNGYIGIGFNQYANRTLGIANAAENAAQSFYSSGCKIDGILKSTKPLSDKQKYDIRNAWNQVHQNGNDGLCIIGSDMDYTSIGSTANDAQLLETRLFNVSEVARYFNISPVLLQDLSKSSYNTIEASTLDFLIHTLSPFINMLNEELSRKLLMPAERQILKIELCTDEFLIADKTSTATYLSTLTSNGIITINEARHILKYSPMEGADELVIPYTNIDSNTINSQNKDVNEQNEEV